MPRRISLVAILLLVWAFPAAAQPARGATVHVVQRGETLYSIAALYGVSAEAIASVNDLADPALISIGQRLIIPAPGTTPGLAPVYQVQPGDTLELIAQRFRTLNSSIVEANALINPRNIYAGQSLVLPGAAPPDRQIGGRQVAASARETLAGLALRYGVTQRALIDANGLSSADYIFPGMRLLIPLHAAPAAGAPAPTSLPAPIEGIRLHPLPAVQGETLSVRLQVSESLTVTGSFNGQPLQFATSGGDMVAITGINALTEPGLARLSISTTDARGKAVSVDSNVQIVAGGYGSEYLEITPELCAATFDPQVTSTELNLITTTTSVFTPVEHWNGLFRLPAGGDVTSFFGTRRTYNCAPDEKLFHEGTDLRGLTGTPVYAAAGGRVALARELIVRGNAIVIDHGWGVFTGYWHLSKIAVSEGQDVQAGDYIGDIGSTGRSQGAHLHWEMRIMGVAVNVRQWTIEAMP